ncbi:MAG: hypothetical protein GX595_05920, partial [Lentisphaerae bacterium]|nr:hypothetical protein [Lentisphaerota bacterium]
LDLSGLWEFAYSVALPEPVGSALPAGLDFQAAMPVPACWDDELARLRECPFWSRARFNPDHRPLDYPLGDNPPDASTPFLLGVGWYRRRLEIPDEWSGCQVQLRLGGVRLEASVWLNGRHLAHHLGHSTAFVVDLGPGLCPGATNEVVIAVANTRRDRLGCAIRGWKGRSGGITGPVGVHVAGAAGLRDAFVWQAAPGGPIEARAEVAGDLDGGDLSLLCTITDPADGAVLAEGAAEVAGLETRWSFTPARPLPLWSDRDPRLVDVRLQLLRYGRRLDERAWKGGFRSFQRDGRRLLLNGEAIFLRGATEHAYYPETCTPPLDKASYRHSIARLREIGFNWLRFHPSVPSEPCLQAADELGMLIQVEPPLGFQKPEWLDILRACRNHPSVVLYCGGNEECLDEALIAHLADCAAEQKREAPNALFNPQEALRGVEYVWQRPDLGADAVETPWPHNPRRLALLKEFSDCFGQYAWGHLSYACTRADVRLLDERMALYERPILSHENGIIGNYLDLGLAWRYEGTRIGTGMFDSLRRNLAQAGLLDRAALYHRNSCFWAREVRKHNLETARRCRYVNGYDFLGGIDCHWHRVGYTCGVLNEFYEVKPGETADDIRRYNGESVLLMAWDGSRNLAAGTAVAIPVLSAVYGTPPGPGSLAWILSTADGHCLAQGTQAIERVETGATAPLATIAFTTPDFGRPAALRLRVSLTTATRHLDNAWNFWSWPAPLQRPAACLTTRALDAEVIGRIDAGATVCLLGPGPLPALPTSFQPACAGRSVGNLATVIADHPLTAELPHEGWCDWQFAPLLEGGAAVVFSDPALPFDPLIEVVSTYKTIRRQAALFEFRVGAGRLLCCTLNLASRDPAALWLRQALSRYADSAACQPRRRVAAAALASLARPAAAAAATTTDQGFDARAQRRRTP